MSAIKIGRSAECVAIFYVIAGEVVFHGYRMLAVKKNGKTALRGASRRGTKQAMDARRYAMLVPWGDREQYKIALLEHLNRLPAHNNYTMTNLKLTAAVRA